MPGAPPPPLTQLLEPADIEELEEARTVVHLGKPPVAYLVTLKELCVQYCKDKEAAVSGSRVRQPCPAVVSAVASSLPEHVPGSLHPTHP